MDVGDAKHVDGFSFWICVVDDSQLSPEHDTWCSCEKLDRNRHIVRNLVLKDPEGKIVM